MEKLMLAVIGDPIAHTLSPLIQNTIAEKLGLPCSYTAHHVRLPELPDFVDFARRELQGFNITIPHKKNILPYLSGLDPYAEACGAVNTVRVQDGKLYGYNTDGDGLRAAMAVNGIYMEGKNIVMLGAGGAASSIFRKAQQVGAGHITVICRLPEEAAAFSEPGVDIDYFDVETVSDTLKKHMGEADVLINATPLGMDGIDSRFTDFSFLDETKAAVVDIVYKPSVTALVAESRKRGLTAMNGLGMLIYQAVYAFSIFSGETFDFDEMAAHVTRVVSDVIYHKEG